MIKALHLLLLCLALSPIVGRCETLVGRVVGVADGDTITVLDSLNQQHKIRLAGIDAPEKAQPYGQRSKQSLSDLVFGKSVTVDIDKKDKYRRWVGKVLVDGTDANLEQVRRGLAWHYKAYEADQPLWDRVTYARAKKVAQERRRGLWGDSQPIPPWEHRQQKRKKAAPLG